MKSLYKVSVLCGLFLFGCELASPYQITFTTPEGAEVNPEIDTLDLAVNEETLAYISAVECEGQNVIQLLPVASADMLASRAHNLSLELLKGQPGQTHCDITVSAYDRSTTSTSKARIELVIAGEKPEEPTEQMMEVEEPKDTEAPETQVSCEETGGVWNECASPCEDGAEVCIQMCVPECEMPTTPSDAPTEPSTETPSE